jgi:exosome complex component RRP4
MEGTAESVLLAHDKDVVAPGEVLAEGMEYLPSHGTYRKNEKIYANQTGLLVIEGKVLKTIPLAGVYIPKRGDTIIGKVIDILMTGWRFDTNSPYSAVLPLKDATFDYIKKGADLTAFFDLDEYVVCRIVQVTSQNLVDVSMKGPGLRKLKGGRIIRVNAMKVPRIIGKRGSMVSMIKQATGCILVVGQNGLVWLKGEPEQEIIAVDAIRKIEREAHVSGLTERMKTWLQEKTGKTVNSELYEEPEESTGYERRYDRGERRDYGERGGGRFGDRRREYGGRRDYGRRGYGRDDRRGGFGGDRERREYRQRESNEFPSEPAAPPAPQPEAAAEQSRETHDDESDE